MSENERMQRDLDSYSATIERLEPDIHMIDAGAGWASIAISLKRIADALEKIAGPGEACNTYGESFLPALTRAVSDGLHNR